MGGPLDSLPPALSGDLQTLSAVMRSARSAYAQVLEALGVNGEQALLDAVYAGRIALHAGSEPYLSARTLATLQHNAREAMQRLLAAPDAEEVLPHELAPHIALHAALSDPLPPELSGGPRLTLDAVELEVGARGTLVVRYAAADAWSMRWRTFRATDDGTLCDLMLPGLASAGASAPTPHSPASFERRVRLVLQGLSDGGTDDAAD